MSLIRNPRSPTSLLNWVSHKVSTFKKPQPPINPRRSLSSTTTSKLPRNEIRRLTQLAMFDYFYNNRGLQFLIAESMSKNAPLFNDTLLNKLHNDSASCGDDVIRSITKFLLYHPVNEFEPFFESLGLKPSEFSPLVPCDKMFLNEDVFLLENYHVFWNYGIGREKMGKIFKEAREVFGYESGVLASKIESLERLGFGKVFVSKLIVCTPRVLTGETILEMVSVVDTVGSDWVLENLSEGGSYDWRCIHRCLAFLRELCGGDESEVLELIKNRPGLVLEESGEWTMILAGFQTKLGCSRSELVMRLPPQSSQEVGKCVSNLRHCFLFLRGIKMEAYEIGKVFRNHSHWLGESRLKHTSTFLNNLKGGKKRLCQVIQENPEEMKKWTMGLRVTPLPGTSVVDVVGSKAMKTQFLLELGYEEKEMERALRCFRGRGSELRERFEFLKSLGLSEGEAKEMVKASPDVLTQASNVLEAKVDYLVNELGYPLSTLVAFPSCLKYTLERMKVRFAMYNWLQERGKADAKLAISTILVYSDKSFVTRFVNRHPDGAKYFEELKRTASL
ncbi:transcription termination factor MTEF18, mitochondrial [Brassica rapa]|uniref:Transcription termination factor MTEF18, mitochondrial-like n=1 Tax=Brassica campestris TaxID=3711 RepID=M4EIV1_BRACM|nr:transcription termination factor MTEF18, mitochondrial [Brassica rapa]